MRLRTEKTEDVYASFDAETVDKLIQFIKIQNEIEKEKTKTDAEQWSAK